MFNNKKPIYYDYINTPNFKVSMAIRISIGMPLFFAPIDIDGNKYIDGAILDNYPISLFNKELDKTIGILICNEYNTNYKYFEQYFFAVINLFMHQYYLKTADQYVENTICVNKSPDNVFIFNFDLDNETKKKYLIVELKLHKNLLRNIKFINRLFYLPLKDLFLFD
uniref:Putative patatin-like phospholipase n=1 Tax=Moumouvirus sp. 'Monve' TaxID=1128131 RepID=H2EEN4_9VIRU|nr:putative patatin-like phospholipase [Moumouvirus Monve]